MHSLLKRLGGTFISYNTPATAQLTTRPHKSYGVATSIKLAQFLPLIKVGSISNAVTFTFKRGIPLAVSLVLTLIRGRNRLSTFVATP